MNQDPRLWVRIRDDLRSKIDNGNVKPGDSLPIMHIPRSGMWQDRLSPRRFKRLRIGRDHRRRQQQQRRRRNRLPGPPRPQRRHALIVARTSHEPALLKPSPHLIDKAVRSLNADPAATALGSGRRFPHRHQGSPPRRCGQHRLREQARQTREHDPGPSRSRSSHHQHGRLRPQTPWPPITRVTRSVRGLSRPAQPM